MRKPVNQGRPRAVLSSNGFKAWIASLSVISLVFAFQSYYSSLIGPISNVLPTACVGCAFVSALLCAKRYGLGTRTKFQAIWVSFAIGTGLWIIAEFTWAFYNFVLNVPVPTYSIADVFYMAGYFPMFAGLILYLTVFRSGMDKKRLGSGLAAIGVAAIVVMATVIPTEVAANPTLVQSLDDLSFVILDLVLLSLTILSFVIFTGGTIAKWFVMFGVGSALYVVADEDYLILVNNGTYYNGSYNDLIFLLAYLTFAFAFYLHRRII